MKTWEGLKYNPELKVEETVKTAPVRQVVIEIPKATEKPDSLKVALLELEAEAKELTEEAEELEQRFEYLSGRLDAISKAATALKAVMGL